MQRRALLPTGSAARDGLGNQARRAPRPILRVRFYQRQRRGFERRDDRPARLANGQDAGWPDNRILHVAFLRDPEAARATYDARADAVLHGEQPRGGQGKSGTGDFDLHDGLLYARPWSVDLPGIPVNHYKGYFPRCTQVDKRSFGMLRMSFKHD